MALPRSIKSKTTLIGIACGIVCALCVFLYVQEVNGSVEAARAEALARYGGEQLEICTASHDLSVGTTITAGDVQTKLWVVDLLPADAVRSSSDIIGRQVTSPILQGEVISLKRFEDQAFSIEVPSGMSAVCVPAKAVQAVGGALAPGMKVDVYSTGDAATTRIGQELLVLATSASTSGNVGDSAVTWITLAVDPQQVQEFVVAAQETKLYFVLPNTPQTANPSMQNELLSRGDDKEQAGKEQTGGAQAGSSREEALGASNASSGNSAERDRGADAPPESVSASKLLEESPNTLREAISGLFSE